ncbi:hypothetical protein [Natronorarus salvus]|uniref:hypothetical protein n=1 Tax=Natronorarus salvus TaxID=3117733 RepID=UPI002F26DA61
MREGRLAVEVDLTLETEGEELSISGEGQHLTVDVPSIGAAKRTLRGIGTLPVERLGTGFVEEQLSADVRIHGVVVARIGPYVEPTRLSRALGVAPARVYPVAGLRAALKR